MSTHHRHRLVSLGLAAAILALVSSPAEAILIEDFHFNDRDGTALGAAANSASPHQWIEDTDHVASIQVQSGSLTIAKNDTNFVTEGLGFDDVSSGVLWMVAEFANWAVVGSAPDGNNVEEIRFGFMGTEDLVPPPSSTVLAEMMLARNFAAGTFELSGTALGVAGGNIAPATINLVQNDPFVMAMKVDQDAETYSLWYKDGANPFVLVGTNSLEPTRDAVIVRMTFNNFWGDDAGEFANLDRFYISDAPPTGIPVPEPSFAMLAAVAAGWFGWRRRAVCVRGE